jgi:cytochrome c553
MRIDTSGPGTGDPQGFARATHQEATVMYQHVFPLVLALAITAPAIADETELVPCLDCHQATTRLGEVPLIEGQHAAYLKAQLERFRERHRESFPMDSLTRGFSDETIARKVSEISSRPWVSWPSEPAASDAKLLQLGAEVVEHFRCATCHGPDFIGGDVIPRLAGQRPGYLEQQFKAMEAGRRYHPPTAIGASIDSLDESERPAVALWLSRVVESR